GISTGFLSLGSACSTRFHSQHAAYDLNRLSVVEGENNVQKPPYLCMVLHRNEVGQRRLDTNLYDPSDDGAARHALADRAPRCPSGIQCHSAYELLPSPTQGD